MKKSLQIISAGILLTVLCTSCGKTDGGTPADNSEKYTEEMIMADTNIDRKCISVSEELNITLGSGEEPNEITSAYTWVVNELVLNSSAEYSKPLEEATLDLELTNGTTTYVIPGFWDGGKVWKVRFACTSAGEWTYKTVCSNTEDSGLNNITGKIDCKEYTGELDIYKHGFVKTEPNTRNFVYADGTPFFYLGDTHWGMGGEPIDIFKESVKKRVEQGFTVIQSEPLNAGFNLADGLGNADVKMLKKFDNYFFEIADKGLVHANASLFFPSSMPDFIKKFGGYSDVKMGTVLDKTTAQSVEFCDINDSVKEQLDILCRYWTARYGAFPVMWTLGQEVDDDFYWSTTSAHKDWSYINNPYKYVAEYTYKYDAYKNPLSAHQEGMNTTAASNSAFRDVPAHTWYAAQWKWPRFNQMLDYQYQRDYWENGQGKPCVLYEGYYWNLWTKDMGARAQGWLAYTNGTFGYGWGGQDTWYYLSSYDEDKDSKYDNVDVITAQQKVDSTWESAKEAASTYQMGYMRNFLEGTVKDWWNLVPRFDDKAYFTPASEKVLYSQASNADNSKILIYFYNFSEKEIAEIPNSTEEEAKLTGTVGTLQPKQSYVYVWFDVVSGKKVSSGTFTADANGTWNAGEKLTHDMALYIVKQ